MMLKIILIAIIFVAAVWIWQNPVERFGLSFFGLTTYNRIPYPYFDLKIYAKGSVTIRQKSHFLSLQEISDLIPADTVVIGTG